LKSGQGGQDRSTNPDRVFSFRRSYNFNLHRMYVYFIVTDLTPRHAPDDEQRFSILSSSKSPGVSNGAVRRAILKSFHTEAAADVEVKAQKQNQISIYLANGFHLRGDDFSRGEENSLGVEEKIIICYGMTSVHQYTLSVINTCTANTKGYHLDEY